MRKAALTVASALIGLVLALIIVELGYRAYLWAYSPVLVYQPGGKHLHPNGHGDYRGGHTTLDKYGLRTVLDEEVRNRKTRILVIGDSLTFGAGVDDDDTFVHLLNERYAMQDVGFINLGFPGLDTWMLRSIFFGREDDYRPYYGVLWVYYINDARTNAAYLPIQTKYDMTLYSDGRFASAENAVWRYLKSPALIKHLVVNIIARFKDNKKTQGDDVAWRKYYELSMLSYHPYAINRRIEMRYLKEIMGWMDERGVKLWFMLAPALDQLTDNRADPQDFIRSVVDSKRYPILDLLPEFQKLVLPETFYKHNDHAHWNPKGHAFVADEIVRFLGKSAQP